MEMTGIFRSGGMVLVVELSTAFMDDLYYAISCKLSELQVCKLVRLRESREGSECAAATSLFIKTSNIELPVLYEGYIHKRRPDNRIRSQFP
jgi:hypothetical protein